MSHAAAQVGMVNMQVGVKKRMHIKGDSHLSHLSH
jgi:hypothetical protein